MEKQDYTLSDVRDFMLKELSLNWFFEIFNEELGVYKRAEIDDFKILKATKFQVKNLDKEDFLHDIKIVLHNNTFKVVGGKDLSLEWIKYKNQLEMENVAKI